MQLTIKKLCKANKMKHFTLQILQHFYNAVRGLYEEKMFNEEIIKN
jgi:hypothetical protein